VQSVTDSANYGPRVAPGSLASLFGSGLSTGTQPASGFPLLTTLAGTSVSFGGTLVPLLYVSPTQINFQVPSSAKAGAVNVVVNGPGGASASFSATVVAASPSIYQYGTNHAVAQNDSGDLNSADAPASAGSVVTVYLTGQGAVNHAVTDGSPAPPSPLATANAVSSAVIGAVNAPVQFLGLTPSFAGLAQANITVPNLPSGDYPLVLTVGGYVSASVVISVSGSGTYTSPLTLAASAAFTNSYNSDIQLYSEIAYVCGSSRIVMVDVSTPTSPTLIGDFGSADLNGAGGNCTVNASGSIPYLVDIFYASSGQQSFAVYNLANPRSPVRLTIAATSYSHLEFLRFSGNFGFVTNSYITYVNQTAAIQSQTGDFLVFDFTNPAHPVFLVAMQANGIPGSDNLNQKPYATIAGLYAFIAGSTATGATTKGAGALTVVNISSPSAPIALTQVQISQATMLMSLDIAGNTLLAAGNSLGQRNPGKPDFDFTGYLTLSALDITNPLAPVISSSTITTTLLVNGTFHTQAFSDGVFVIVNKPPMTDNFGPASLMVADARTPASILLYPVTTQFGLSSVVTTTNGFVLAPTTLGLNVYQRQI
jgi:uncharacterized protein (TIGR03437 family)